MRATVGKNLVLLCVLLVLVAAHWAVPSDPTRRNFHFTPNMVHSYAHEAQAPPPTLAAGFSVDLRPPEGSIARGFMPYAYLATPEDALRAGRELSNPNPDDGSEIARAAVERGRFIFANFCAVCHGGTGEGDGPVTRRGVPPPPSLLLPHALDMADGQMFHVITFGQANMASYASQVDRDDRWNVINFLRTMQAETEATGATDLLGETGVLAETDVIGETAAKADRVEQQETEQ